jgi:ankyrin repeat protein
MNSERETNVCLILLSIASFLPSSRRRQADEDGGTALHDAAYGGHPAVVDRLLQSGADINHPGKTHLHFGLK